VTIALAVGGFALLFIVFGFVRPRASCSDGGCGACGGTCQRRDHEGGKLP